MATRKSLSIYGCFWLFLSGGVILVRYWLSGAYQIYSPITALLLGYYRTVLMSGNRELAFHLSRGGGASGTCVGELLLLIPSVKVVDGF